MRRRNLQAAELAGGGVSDGGGKKGKFPSLNFAERQPKSSYGIGERDEKIRVEATNCAEVASLREMLNPTNQRYLSDKDTIFSLDEFEALGSGVAPATNPSMNTTTTKLFSNVTRLGYAAAYDSPALRAVELANSSGIMDATQEASGSHGPSTAAIPSSYASILSSSTKSESEGGPEMHNSNGNGITRKGKKPNRVLLSTAGGRRY